MPILQNAKKALRVSKRKTIVNSRIKSIMKTMIDKVTKQPTGENLSEAYSAVDTAVKNKLVQKNKAARVKAQLGKLVKPGAKKPAKSTKKPGKAPVKKKTAKKAAPKKAAAKKLLVNNAKSEGF